MAHAAGIQINWDDFSDLSEIVPLLARIYPNGAADVNHFHAAGGIGFLIRELISSGLLHQDTVTVVGQGLEAYTREPWLSPNGLEWRPAPEHSGDREVLRPITDPFGADGGLKVLRGNLGRGVIKTSAVQPQHRVVEAPARVFNEQEDVIKAFKAGELARDCVVVVRYQGPRANGMPELHQLTPTLTSLQSKGHKVALVTDGRMSGASGAVPAAIHVTPESLAGGPLAKVQDGDIIHLDSYTGVLEVKVSEAVLRNRLAPKPDLSRNDFGFGRELFATFRAAAADAEAGAASIYGGL
jgi:phosphogluconate dehydratase